MIAASSLVRLVGAVMKSVGERQAGRAELRNAEDETNRRKKAR
jgi:hypothetical protein